jgi:hypothetical protein
MSVAMDSANGVHVTAIRIKKTGDEIVSTNNKMVGDGAVDYSHQHADETVQHSEKTTEQLMSQEKPKDEFTTKQAEEEILNYNNNA